MAHRALSVGADRYENATFVWKGGFSLAFRTVRKADGMEIVVKETNIHELSMSSGETMDVWRAKAEREFTLMAKAKHANIIRAFDFYIIDNHAHLLLEFCDAGSLKSVTARRLGAKIRGEAGLFPETKIWRWIAQMVRAIRYLHDQCKILHEDINAENVFLTHGGDVAKLGDFGISRQLDTMRGSVEMTSASANYIPPETLSPPYEKYNSQSEIWALGIVSQLIANLQLPFEAASIPELMQIIMKNEPPALSGDFSDDLQQLVSKMLNKDRELRPTIDEIWKHRRIAAALEELAVRFPHLNIDLSSPDAGRLASEMIKDELRAFVRELEDKDMAWRLRVNDLESEMATSNAKLNEELAECKTNLEAKLSSANAQLVAAKNALGVESKLSSCYSKLLEMGKMTDGENKKPHRDYFKYFPLQPRTFFRNTPSEIVAILAIPMDDWLTGSTCSATALVVVCAEGQIIALAPPSWEKLAWRNDVTLPQPLTGSPKFFHAAYDSADKTVYINHNRTSVLAQPCVIGGNSRVAIGEKQHGLTDIGGLAIASELRRLFICNGGAANKGLTIWGLPLGTQTDVNLLATIKSDSAPEFCGLGWQDDAILLATSRQRERSDHYDLYASSIQDGKVVLHRTTVGRACLADPASTLHKQVAIPLGAPRGVAVDLFGNLFVVNIEKCQRRIKETDLHESRAEYQFWGNCRRLSKKV